MKPMKVVNNIICEEINNRLHIHNYAISETSIGNVDIADSIEKVHDRVAIDVYSVLKMVLREERWVGKEF